MEIYKLHVHCAALKRATKIFEHLCIKADAGELEPEGDLYLEFPKRFVFDKDGISSPAVILCGDQILWMASFVSDPAKYDSHWIELCVGGIKVPKIRKGELSLLDQLIYTK